MQAAQRTRLPVVNAWKHLQVRGRLLLLVCTVGTARTVRRAVPRVCSHALQRSAQRRQHLHLAEGRQPAPMRSYLSQCDRAAARVTEGEPQRAVLVVVLIDRRGLVDGRATLAAASTQTGNATVCRQSAAARMLE